MLHRVARRPSRWAGTKRLREACVLLSLCSACLVAHDRSKFTVTVSCFLRLIVSCSGKFAKKITIGKMSHDLQREMDVSTDSALSRDVSTLSEIVEPMESARLSADDVSGPTPPPAVALSREISMESGEGLQGANVRSFIAFLQVFGTSKEALVSLTSMCWLQYGNGTNATLLFSPSLESRFTRGLFRVTLQAGQTA